VSRTKSRDWPKPTQSELEILAILWDLGEATVRQVHEALERRRETGYTTVLKLMQIMADKGLVVRDEAARAHVYTAAPRKEEMQGQLLDDLLDKAFGGSAAQLVLQALSRRKANHEELSEIRRMLDEFEGERR
jgi:predicted transcriptional regulator